MGRPGPAQPQPQGHARFAGRVVLVTGAARGQGRSHAVGFAREGAAVGLCDIATDGSGRGASGLRRTGGTSGSADTGLAETAALVRAAGQRAVAMECDVTDEDAVRRLVSRVLGEFGRIDVLVANAGVLPPRHAAWQIPRSEWDLALAVNLTGAWLCCREVLPHMIAGRSGKVVIISSTGGLKGSPGFAGYSAAKWGVIGLTKTVAMEAAPYGINVNAVCPGPVATGMILNESFRVQLAGESATMDDLAALLRADMLLRHGLISPQAVTDAVLWLASDEARFVTGHALAVDAGYVTK